VVQAALLLPVSRRGGARVAEKQTKKELRDKAGDQEKENQKKKRKKNQKKWWTTARRRGAASGLVAPTSPLPYPPSFPLHFIPVLPFPFSASHHITSHRITEHLISSNLTSSFHRLSCVVNLSPRGAGRHMRPRFFFLHFPLAASPIAPPSSTSRFFAIGRNPKECRVKVLNRDTSAWR